MSSAGRADLRYPHHAVPEICLCICLVPSSSDAVPSCATSLPCYSSLIYPQQLESTPDVLVILGFVEASKEVTPPWLSAGVAAGQQRARADLTRGGTGDGLGRSCGSPFSCFLPRHRIKWTKTRLQLGPCPGAAFSKGYGGCQKGGPSPTGERLGKWDAELFPPLVSLALGSMQGFQTGRIKGWKHLRVFLQLQTMNQHSPGTVLGEEGKNPGLE